MKLFELEKETLLSIKVVFQKEELQYETRVLEVLEGSVLVDAIRSEEGKILDFSSPNLNIDIYIPVEGDKPLVFEGVEMKCVTFKKNVYHQIITDKEAKAYNRRDAVRVYVGVKGKTQIGPNKTVMEIIVKDVSVNGFAIVTETEVLGAVGNPVRVVFRDEDKYLDINGVVVRTFKLENGKYVYGCNVPRHNFDLEKYVSFRQRKNMSKNN